jgi:S1-C subfamily serine protease
MFDRTTTERIAEIYEGVPVLGLLPGSPAERAGIKTGDIVLEVNGTRTRTLDAFVNAKGFNKGVMVVRVVRGGQELELTLTESEDESTPATPEGVAALIAASGAATFVGQEPRRRGDLN